MSELNTDKSIRKEFEKYSKNNIELLWLGRPTAIKTFLMNDSLKLIGGLFSFISFSVIALFIFPEDTNLKDIILFNNDLSIMFYLIMLTGVYQYFILPFITYYKSFYAITPYSIIIKSGLLFKSYKTIDITKIIEIKEKSNLQSTHKNVSSITIWDGRTTGTGIKKKNNYFYLINLTDSKEVLLLIEKLKNNKIESFDLYSSANEV